MEEDILDRLKRNDRKALEELFSIYYSDLVRFAARYLGRPLVAEEIVQDLFVYLWENRTTLTIRHSLEAYLYRAVKNKCINFAKSKANQKHEITDHEEVTEHPSVTENELEIAELRELIEYALQSMPAKTSMIFTLSRNSDLTYKEIARQLNISQKTVEYHISSALRLLESFLKKHGYTFLISLPVLTDFLL